MIQHQLLQPGKLIVTRDMPHTPATGVIEVQKVENSVVHFRYRRTGEEETRDEHVIGKADAEFMISRGYWTDAGEVKILPMMMESEIDGLHDEDEVFSHLRAATDLTWYFERYDNAQVRAEAHRMLDRHIDDRLKEMKGC